MAEEQEQEKKEQPKEKSGLGTGAIIGIVLGSQVILAILFVVSLKIFFSDNNGGHASTQDTEQEAGHEDDGDEDGEDEDDGDEDSDEDNGQGGYIVEMQDDIITNPRGSSGRLVAVRVGLEVPSAEDEPTIEGFKTPIRDLVRRSLADMTVDELNNVDKVDSLQKELRTLIQAQLGKKTKLYNIYFPRFVVQ